MTLAILPNGLNEYEEKFCHEFLKDLKVVAAMVRAGYSDTYADKKCGEFFRKEKIQNRISELKQERESRTRIDVDEVLRRLVRIADETESIGDYQPALRALEMLGKHLSMFTDKSEIKFDNPLATGQDQDAIERDVARLTRIATPQLQVIEGDKSDDDEDQKTGTES